MQVDQLEKEEQEGRSYSSHKNTDRQARR